MASYTIQIPDNLYSGVAAFILLDDATFQKMNSVLKDIPPTISLGTFTAQVIKNMEVVPEGTEDIVRFLSLLHFIQYEINESTDNLLPSLMRAIERVPLETLSVSDYDENVIRERIRVVLEHEQSLGIVAKAGYVLSQQERFFVQSQVQTDIRPVFRIDSQEPPIISMISHTLQLIYYENEKHKSFYITLDSADLQNLIEKLTSAVEKGEILTSWLNSTEVPVLDIKGEKNA